MRRLAAVIGFGLFLASCGEDDSRTGDIEPQARGLKTCEVAKSETNTVRRYPSVLQPSSITSLSFEISGKLQQVTLDVGQTVSEGEVLARIDPRSLQTQVDNASAALKSAEVTTQNAKDDYERKATLLEQGVSTKAQTDQALTTWKSNEAQEEQARKQLENAEQDLERAELKAPFDGIVGSVDMQSYTNVTAGTPVLTLYADDEFESAFTVSFDTVHQLTVGKPAHVRLADDPSVVLAAHVSELGSRADTVSSFPVVVKLDETNPLLKSGMAVEISLEFTVPSGSGYTMPLTIIPMGSDLSTPQSADGTDFGNAFVYDPETETVKSRSIRIGGLRDNQLIVIDGLEPGELVACAGVSFLRDGMKVRLLSDAQ